MKLQVENKNNNIENDIALPKSSRCAHMDRGVCVWGGGILLLRKNIKSVLENNGLSEGREWRLLHNKILRVSQSKV